MDKTTKQQIIKDYGRAAGDTGSPEVKSHCLRLESTSLMSI